MKVGIIPERETAEDIILLVPAASTARPFRRRHRHPHPAPTTVPWPSSRDPSALSPLPVEATATRTAVLIGLAIGLRKPSPAVRTSGYTAADGPQGPPRHASSPRARPAPPSASASPCVTPAARQQRDQTKRSRAPRGTSPRPPRVRAALCHKLGRRATASRTRTPSTPSTCPRPSAASGPPSHAKTPRSATRLSALRQTRSCRAQISPRTHAHRRHETNGGDTNERGEEKKQGNARAEGRTRKEQGSRKLGHSASSLTPIPHRRRRSRNTQGYRRPTQVRQPTTQARRIPLVPSPARTPPLLCITAGTRSPDAASAIAVPVPVLRVPAPADRRYKNDGGQGQETTEG
ncbi:hypothetical protein DFH09DRAFT_1453041 [Mycena vulgaris]|nr:hypothetical protein DFH09DRAFT_1453041 [Mycena vulgaris]